MVASNEVTLDLASEPNSIARARRAVRELAQGLAKPLVDDAELLTSELVTNAVRHGKPAVRLTVTVLDGTLTVRVFDGGPAMPVVQTKVGADVPSGRGLLMVELVAPSWGVDVDPDGSGKTVWFRMEDQRWS